MTTLHLPANLPKPTLEEIRNCPIRSRIDDICVRIGLNPPPIDGRDMILHISDTPSTMFPYLRRAIRRLRPAWVVHTGDLVDDIKHLVKLNSLGKMEGSICMQKQIILEILLRICG
jgi:hypothetical protein